MVSPSVWVWPAPDFADQDFDSDMRRLSLKMDQNLFVSIIPKDANFQSTVLWSSDRGGYTGIWPIKDITEVCSS